MIENVSLNPVTPIQQRTTTGSDGDQTQQIKTDDAKASGTANSDQTQSDQNSSQQTSEQKKKLEEVVKSLNDFLKPQHTSLRFKLYAKLNTYYCQVIDDNTQEVIREIPPKKLLDSYAIMAEQLGFITDKKI